MRDSITNILVIYLMEIRFPFIREFQPCEFHSADPGLAYTGFCVCSRVPYAVSPILLSYVPMHQQLRKYTTIPESV